MILIDRKCFVEDLRSGETGWIAEGHIKEHTTDGYFVYSKCMVFPKKGGTACVRIRRNSFELLELFESDTLIDIDNIIDIERKWTLTKRKTTVVLDWWESAELTEWKHSL